MCVLREKRVRDFFVCEGQTWQKSKKKRKKAAGKRQKRAKKSKKNKKSKKKRKKKRETQKEFFFKDTNSLLFFALLSLEKIHLIERRLRTHQEDFTKTL